MTFSLRFRLVALALIILALAAMIGAVAYATSQQVHALRKNFSGVREESFRMADYLQESVLTLNETLLRFALGRDPADWQKFSQDSQDFVAWLSAQEPDNSRGRDVIAQIRTAFTSYRAEADAIAASPFESNSKDALPVLSRIEHASQKLLDLGYDLATAHRAETGRLFTESQRSLTRLQEVVFGALVLLVIFGAWGITIVYRETIAPLRLKLIESRAIMERQEKLASLGVLAAGVAHEIRNPLTAIQASVFMLKAATPAASEACNHAITIEREIIRLERIVRDVLSFARPGEPTFATISSTALLTYVAELMHGSLVNSAIELAIEDSPNLAVRCDRNQLTQVLLNLVQNAADSIGQGGRITLRSRCGRFNLAGRNMAAVIMEVEDTGKGIPADVQKRLFDPFFTTKPAGTGLGLSIAARIIESNGGALQYATQLNRGTTFAVILPVAVAEENAAPPFSQDPELTTSARDSVVLSPRA
jgi:signal transduction histidine kinase